MDTNSRRFGSLSRWLALTIGTIVLVTTVTVSLADYWSGRLSITRQIDERTASVSKETMAATDAYLAARLEELRAMTTSQLQVASISAPDRAKVLFDYAGAFGSQRYADLTILDLSGNIVASTGAPQVDKNGSYVARFARAVRPGILDLRHFSDQSVDTFVVYAPMFDDNGKHIDTLIGRLLPTELVTLVRNIPLNADTAIYLVHGGAVFAENRGPTAPARDAAATMRARLADTSSAADLGFSVETVVDQRAALAPLRDLALRSTLIGLAVLLLAGLAAVWTARRIAAPLERVRESAHALALGHLDASVEQRSLGAIRELADLGGSFNTMADGLRALVGGIGTTSNAIAGTAKENLGTAQLLRAGTGESAHAAAQIVAALARLGASAHKVLDDCVSLEASSRGGLEQIGALVGEVDETNAALLQLSDTVARSDEAGRTLARHALDVAERARDVGVRAETAQASADRGGDAVRELVGDVRSVGNSLLTTVARLEHLAESTAQAINTQVKVITDLAERSELLALNAGIEAARAGAHGRGFTVIAQELHHLATGSHEAGREVGTLVHSVITETQALVKTARSASDLARTAIAHAGTTGEEIERLISEIGESTRAASEIAQIAANQAQETAAIERATGEMRGMADATAGSAQRVGEIARAVRSVIDIATDIAARVATTAREQTAALAIIEGSASDIERANVDVANAAERSFATSNALDRQLAALTHTVGAFGTMAPRITDEESAPTHSAGRAGARSRVRFRARIPARSPRLPLPNPSTNERSPAGRSPGT